MLFEKGGVIFLENLGQEGREGGLHISDKTEIQRRPAAEVFRIAVNLHFFHLVVRQELGGRKIRAEHEKTVRAVNGFVCSAVADETGHARSMRVVMFEPLLAAEGVSDGGFHCVGQGQYFVVRVAAAIAAEDGDSLCIVDHLSELFHLQLARKHTRITERHRTIRHRVRN
jgi:hypothetical protein